MRVIIAKYGIRVPPNVRFLVDDIEDEWVEGAPFDYIHARYLTAAIADWPKLARQTYESVHTYTLTSPTPPFPMLIRIQ